MNQQIPGYLFEMNSMGLREFVSTKEGALNIIEQLRGGAKCRLRFSEIREYILALVSSPERSVYQSYSMPEDLSVHRVRKLPQNQQWFSRVETLGPPQPEETVNYGRCHQPRRPLCYCSLRLDTALAEVNAELGERYAIATFQLPKNAVVIPIGEFDYFRRTGQTYIGHSNTASATPYREVLAREDSVVAAAIDAFLADEFIKPAASHTDYKITSSFCDILLNDFNPRCPIDALVYPSVAFRGGLNFAIRPEALQSKMRLIEVETTIIEITDVVGYGIFGYRELAKLKTVTPQGCLVWE